jgi:hypothetical protein
MLRHVGTRENVEPASDAVEDAPAVEPRERLAGDAERGEVLRTKDAALTGEVEEAISVIHEASVLRRDYRRNVTLAESPILGWMKENPLAV